MKVGKVSHDPTEETSKQHTIWHELIRATTNVSLSLFHIVSEIVRLLVTKTIEDMSKTRRNMILVTPKREDIFPKKKF